VWVYLSRKEAIQLLQALQFWAAEDAEETTVPWHTHITDTGRELSVAVDPGDDQINFAKPS